MRTQVFGLAFILALLGGQLSCNDRFGFDDGGNGAGDSASACLNLQCAIPHCPGGATTTISGVVNIPAGNLPLYNASVYVPNSALSTFVDGPSCDRCDSALTGSPVTSTTTDVNGRFTLKNVPAGASIPLVVSLGKWRRELTLPTVHPCTDNPLDPELTRLPRTQKEGHIPKIAVTTGAADAIECLFRSHKLGLADSEITPEGGTGRVNLFAGNGGTSSYDPSLNGGAIFTVAPDSAKNKTDGWWSQAANWNKYDLVLLSCESDPYPNQKSSQARGNLLSYINNGGRVFASHWHNIWILGGPAPLPSIASFPDSEAFQTLSASIDTSSDKGKVLASWLVNVGASTTPGSLVINNARDTAGASINTALTQRYVYYQNGQTQDAQYFTFNAPIGAAAGMQCGRMVFTDMHVSGNDPDIYNPNLDFSAPSRPFPTGCVTNTLSAQEKALIFLIFDLTGCVQPVLG